MEMRQAGSGWSELRLLPIGLQADSRALPLGNLRQCCRQRPELYKLIR